MKTRKIETVMTYEQWKRLLIKRLKEKIVYWLIVFLGTFGTMITMFFIWLHFGY